jgi:hypothetical protein
MALSDSAIRAATVRDKQYKVSDKKGLFLLVHPNGSKYWRVKYRFGGKEIVLALGVNPEVGLRRIRRTNAISEVRADPSQACRRRIPSRSRPGSLRIRSRRPVSFPASLPSFVTAPRAPRRR